MSVHPPVVDQHAAEDATRGYPTKKYGRDGNPKL
jgi:hypothetical protein